jgi:hypothetical protein
MREVSASVVTCAGPDRALNAFLDPGSLRSWWAVERALVEPREGGVWCLAWDVTPVGLGHVVAAVVDTLAPSRYLLLDHFVYLEPGHRLLGPMTLEVCVDPLNGGSEVEVCQGGYGYGRDWDWYYWSVQEAWPRALSSLKAFLDEA